VGGVLEDALPEQLIAQWREAGWCSYGNGLLWLTDPRQFHGILEDWGVDETGPKPPLGFLRTAFAHLYFWHEGAVHSLDVHRGSVSEVTKRIQRIFSLLCDEEIAEKMVRVSLHQEAVARLRPPTRDECYAFEPATTRRYAPGVWIDIPSSSLRPMLRSMKRLLLIAMAAILGSCGGDSDGDGDAGGAQPGDTAGSSTTGDATPCTIRLEGDVQLEGGVCFAVPTNGVLQVHGDVERDPAPFDAAGVDAVSSVWQYLDRDLAVGTYTLADLDSAVVTVRLVDGTIFATSSQAGEATLTLTAWAGTLGGPHHGTIVGTLPEQTTEPDPRTISMTIEF
jgi:hypothetical protein